jgi:hypothetical protein
MSGRGRASTPTSPSWAEISIMTECTHESGHCYAVCALSSLWLQFNGFQVSVADRFSENKYAVERTPCIKLSSGKEENR